ncbi:hypothetical protein KO507_08200 [Gilvimarinus agarilyticus]|uniref:hypothetical protein n=1 Tax=unclassified Gilvimarinus TaxID=2642066 RepID=UPI001C097C2F|nr:MULTISPECIES: hypothetical protein [unclassified Gilvimarinus]MBU2885740.1 hypothetical protein [Gilvimarinus agarilyticus]MDO6570600.1 hypothetical protein [Gilvimarinus sp. 2_MG-2023]MDO6748179.1 hypothetical protein [Gilvimarinus sp. 1_MG-2023]
MTLKQTLSRHPLLGLCLSLMALLGLAGALLTLHFAQGQLEQDASHYGEALAERGASQAVEPAISQDMISLQVILQAIAQQPRVSGATIHDVENQLLVQSGSGDAPQHYAKLNFSAPITLDTHIAGHLTVSLALPPTHYIYARYIVIWALMVMAAMSICALSYRHLCQNQTDKTSAPTQPEPDQHACDTTTDLYAPETAAEQAPHEQEVPEQETPEQTAWQETGADESEEPLSNCADAPYETSTVIVHLELINLKQLQQQLSLHGYQQCLQKFNQLMKGILALYAGQWVSLEDGRLTLIVNADTRDDASFYGICIGHLTCTLSQEQTSPRIKVAARVLSDSAHNNAIYPELPMGTIWVDPSLHSYALSDHIAMCEQQCVNRILPPYQALLERQSSQLLAAVRQNEPS